MVTAGTVSAQTQKELLDELDRTIEEAESYVSAKEVRIKTIENTLHSRGVSPERQYRIYGELFDEYQPFNYGKAVETLDKQMEIAMLLGDKSKLNDVYLKEAMLNTAAGEFLEARNDLAGLTRPYSQKSRKSLTAMSSNGSGSIMTRTRKVLTNPCLEKWRITVSACLPWRTLRAA